ncbi:hypothetical protein [Parafrankia discariae]|uniref:hypothetical protein n=1 Tax=Parafrankia discariae TaxID=365528 RepID=UPI0003A62EEF|nr:hypothetical protein [Parafrankia discariae]
MAKDPAVYRHALAFSADLSGSSSGRFDQLRWQVTAGVGPAGKAGTDLDLAGLHELAHALLNDSTSWGTVLAALAMPGPDDSEQSRRETLSDLVDSCRTTHECFATHASVQRALVSGENAELALRRYPNYVVYLRQALALAPGPDIDPAVRCSAVAAALTACMQSPALFTLVEQGIRRFRLSMVPVRDHPDTRLQILRGAAAELWSDAPWLRHGDVFARCLVRVGEVLAESGTQTMSRDDHLDMLRAVSTRYAEYSGAATPPRIDTDGRVGLAAAFARETLRLRAPRRAEVVVADRTSPPPPRPGRTGPHLLVTVRPAATLREQFVIDDLGGLPSGDTPVTCVQSPDPLRPGGVGLRSVPDPGSLLEIIRRSAVPIYASVSATCLLDERWCQEWQPALSRASAASILLDLPFDECWHAWKRRRIPLRCGVTVVTVSNQPCAVLVCVLADEAPIVLPVTTVAAAGWRVFVRRADPGTDFEVDADPGPETRDILTDVMSDESSFGARYL